MSGGLEPACVDTIEHSSHEGWQSASEEDIDQLEGCRFCFPDGIDRDDNLLVSSGGCGERVHREKSTGPIDWSAVRDGDRKPSDLKNKLDALRPEDLGLSPLRDGGDA